VNDGETIQAVEKEIRAASMGFLIETRSLPSSLAASLAALPSMSLIPSAPFLLLTSSGVVVRFLDAFLN
jgi:hypothetical protein